MSGVESVPPRKLAIGISYEAFRKIDRAMFGQIVVMRLFREKGSLTQICGNNFMALKAALALLVVLMQASVSTVAFGSEIALTIIPAQSTVHWTVDSTLHTIHGTFQLKGGTLSFDPVSGKVSGEITVLAPSGESGSAARDKRMHNEILETAKFPEVIFRPVQIEGKVASSGLSEVKLAGVLSIHGANHELTATVHSELKGDHWVGTAEFDVPYIDWGIKDPSNFLLKVKPIVHIQVEMSGDQKMTQ